MKQEQEDILAEKELVHRTPSNGITNAMCEKPKSSTLTDKERVTVELKIVGLEIKVIRGFWKWYRLEVSDLKTFERKEVR